MQHVVDGSTPPKRSSQYVPESFPKLNSTWRISFQQGFAERDVGPLGQENPTSEFLRTLFAAFQPTLDIMRDMPDYAPEIFGCETA
jgi:hypothetical protein